MKIFVLLILLYSFSVQAGSSQWVAKPGEGVGPILLGLKISQLKSRVSIQPDEIVSYEEGIQPDDEDLNSDGVINLTYYNYHSLGISVLGVEEVVVTIFLYSGYQVGNGSGGIEDFKGGLPFDMTFATKGADISRKLGGASFVSKNEYAENPYTNYSYDNLGFGFSSSIETDKLGHILIFKKNH